MNFFTQYASTSHTADAFCGQLEALKGDDFPFKHPSSSHIVHFLTILPSRAQFLFRTTMDINVPQCFGQIIVPIVKLRNSAQSLLSQDDADFRGYVTPTPSHTYIYLLDGHALGQLPDHCRDGLRFTLGQQRKLMPHGAAGGWSPDNSQYIADSKGWVDCKILAHTFQDQVSYQADLLLFTYAPNIREALENLIANNVPVAPPVNYSPAQHSGVQAFHGLHLLKSPNTLPQTVTNPPNDCSRELQHRLSKMPSEADLTPVSPGPPIIATLRPHQQAGLAFMLDREREDCLAAQHLWEERLLGDTRIWTHVITGVEQVERPSPGRPGHRLTPEHCRGSILADDMGLGKTIQAISLITSTRELAHQHAASPSTEDLSHLTKSRATLIICPTVLLNTWQEEVIRHTYPGSVSLIEYYGTGREVIPASLLCDSDIVVTTYGVISSEFNTDHKRIFQYHWFRVVLDEAQ